MKKAIVLIGSLIFLTGCGGKPISEKEIKSWDSTSFESVASKNLSNLKVSDSMKEAIKEINSLADKYEGIEDSYNLININLNDPNQIKHGTEVFTSSLSEAYFNDVVDILDETEAVGIKDFVDEYKTKEMDEGIYSSKIGNTVVTVTYVGSLSRTEDSNGETIEEVMEEPGNNYIEIMLNFTDSAQTKYKEVYNDISQDEYIFGGVYYGDKLNTLEFYNAASAVNSSDKKMKIKYNLLFKDENLDKAKMFISKNSEESYDDKDLKVFMNLLDKLEIDESEKHKVVENLKDSLETKVGKKTVDLGKSTMYINDKLNTSAKGSELKKIYISFDKKTLD